MPTFIDLFSGCGGLSFGLVEAGWTGRFAVERHEDAFETFKANLLKSGRKAFIWPKWLRKKAWDIEELLRSHRAELEAMSGSIDLIAGGPPCQGYSVAGRRDPNDKRNTLVGRYLEMVDIIRPKFLVLENVSGFTAGFIHVTDDGTRVKTLAPSEGLTHDLEARGYAVTSGLVNCAEWGIPQRRHRFIAIAVRKDVFRNSTFIDPMRILRGAREVFLASKGLPLDRFVTSREALQDLETATATFERDPEHPRFERIRYIAPESLSPYASLMRSGHMGAPCSLRLPRHRPATSERFAEVLKTCKPGRTLTAGDRKRFASNKHAFTPLAGDAPAPTVTTLPDDMIHYSEPRILTVRELARLQSFPDSFVFRGKYTTGGARRKLDCPRYTQVGNAVPPLLGEALGITIRAVAAISQSTAEPMSADQLIQA